MGEKNKSQKTSFVREFSAGGVVYKQSLPSRGRKAETLWLIVNPAETDRWQFPKGHIEEKESSQNAAIREVAEEGGIEALPIQKIGLQKNFFVWDNAKIFKTVTFFLMKYVSGDPKNHDKEVTEAVFLPFEEAFAKLTFKKDKETLMKAKELLESGIQENLI